MPRRLTALLLSLSALTLPAAAAGAPAKESTAKRPTITRVTPMRLKVGDTLMLRGRNFSSRRTRNTVVFRAPNGRSVFAKPNRASGRRLVVRIPAAVARILGQGPTRIRLRVLSRRFSSFTPSRLSPVLVPVGSRRVAPLPPVAPGTPVPPVAPVADCTAGDFDGDLLSGSLEATLMTDPCVKDTDRDGIEDGFEFRSAVDLNNDEYQAPNQSLPYPGKRPYPNPLDPSDGGVDYDGDALSQAVEQGLWKVSTTAGTRTLSPLTYSDGLQYSVYENRAGHGDRRFPALPAAGYSKDLEFMAWATDRGYRDVYVDVHHPAKPAGVYRLLDANLDGTESPSERLQFDRDRDGYLSDDARDEDADGLSNAEETTRRLRASWWKSCYSGEAPYYVAYAGTEPADPDTDGDGVRDGADDQDHDDVPNLMELSRKAASGLDDTELGRECKVSKAVLSSFAGQEAPIYYHAGQYGRVDPFNPCMPDKSSRTCKRYVEFGAPWAPFDNSVEWLSLN